MSKEQASQALDMLCPMHVMLDDKGIIQHAGPTLKKLRPDAQLEGQHLFKFFDLVRPRGVTRFSDMHNLCGMMLHLRLPDTPPTPFKGILARGSYGYILNLSFGFAVVDAVGTYGLTNADFAPTDLTIEMLYLVEAKSAAMDESRNLNSRLQTAKIAAEEQAYTDTLTGLKNRRALDHVLGRLLEGGDAFVLMQLDLDYFKSINDTLGHAAGDFVLQKVARILVAETRSDDTVARIGGDEFVLLLHSAPGPTVLEEIAKRIISRLEEPIPFGNDVCRISGSAGSVVARNYRDPTADQLMADADKALYASKNAGRGRHTAYSDELADVDTAAPPMGARGSKHPDAA